MTRSTQRSPRFLALAGLAAALALATGPATAAITWNVAGGGAWDTTTPNWTGDSTTFTDNGTVDVIFNNTAGGTITIAPNMSPASTTVSAVSGTYTFTGGPIDLGTLTKSGGGTLTLNGANTYSGGTSITGGEVILGNKNGFGTGTVTLAGGVNFKTSGFEGNSAGGALPNDLILSGGKVNVDVSFGAKDVWINTSVSGPGGFNVTGSNQRNPGLMLSGVKTFQGGVTLGSGGRVTVDNVGSLGTGTLRGENGTLRIAADLIAGVPNNVVIAQGANFNVLVDNGRSGTLSGIISDEGTGGNLVKNDPGTLTLIGSNTYRGATTVSAGTLNIGGAGRLGSGTYAGNIAIAGGASLTYNSSAAQNLTGTISGGGSLTMSGTGTLYLNPGGANIGATPNSFTGGATLSAGTLKVNSAANNGLGTGPFTISGGTIGVGGNNIHTLNNSAYYVNGSFAAVNNGGHTLRFSTGNVTLGASPTVTANSNFTVEVYGTIGDGGNNYGLTKDGAGTIRLNNEANTYTGQTVVMDGTLYAKKIDNVGVASSLGAPTGPNSVIDLHGGASLRAGRPASNVNTTDRVINLAGAGGTTEISILNENDTQLILNSALAATGTGAKTLALSVNAGLTQGDRSGMTINGAIPDVSDGSPLSLQITVQGSQQTKGVTLNGTNTYTGDTTVSSGGTNRSSAGLILGDDAGMRFVIGPSGVNNGIRGVGTNNLSDDPAVIAAGIGLIRNIVQLDGDFTFDLSGAGTDLGDSWNIVDVATLSEIYGSTFTVAGFTDIGSDQWEFINGPATYTFSESTGLLMVSAVVPEPSTFVLGLVGLTSLMFFLNRRRRKN